MSGKALRLTSPFLAPTTTTAALVVLNTPIPAPHDSPVFDKLWHATRYRICADGGANRLHDHNAKLIPDCVCGDLDSLRQDVRELYTTHGVSIELDPCQDANDLDKSLTRVFGASPLDAVYVYGAFGGRFDQEMAAFQALYAWCDAEKQQQEESDAAVLYLYNEETCAVLIPPNRKCEVSLPFYGGQQTEDNPTSAIPSLAVGEGPTCGLIPLAMKCETIVTDGLQWDLDGTVPMEFGGLVSTSNRMMKPVVTIEVSHPIIFTAEIIRRTV